MSCLVLFLPFPPLLSSPFFLKQKSKDRDNFFADVIDNKSFDELVDRINKRARDKAMDAIVRQISDEAGDDDNEDGGGSIGGDDTRQSAVRSRQSSIPTTGKGLRVVKAQIKRLRNRPLSRISTGAAAVTMKQLHPEIPEEAATAVEKGATRDGRAFQSTKTLAGRRSAAILAAMGGFVKAAVKMSRTHLLKYSDDPGKRKVGKPRKVESNLHLCLSDADSIESSMASTATVDAAVEKRQLTASRMPQEEAVIEMQKMYNLKDRYLRVYLQRRFESERLPRLFSARLKSRVHRYAVNDAFEMARKQAARMPPLI